MIVPGTSVVVLLIAAPDVLMFTIGRLILPAAGAKPGLLSETVRRKAVETMEDPTAPTRLTVEVALHGPAALFAGNASLSAWTPTFSAIVPVEPGVRVSAAGDTVMPEGSPVMVTLTGPV